jgi:hypothetical protein
MYASVRTPRQTIDCQQRSGLGKWSVAGRAGGRQTAAIASYRDEWTDHGETSHRGRDSPQTGAILGSRRECRDLDRVSGARQLEDARRPASR